MMMQRFEISLAPDYDSALWEEELEDLFLLKNGVLPVAVSSREI